VKTVAVEAEPDEKLSADEQEQLIRILLEKLEMLENQDRRDDGPADGEDKESA
jgi:hypothetical protein